MQTHYAILICFILLLLVCGCVIEKKEFSTEIIPTEPDKEIFVTLNERINTTPDNADLWYAKAELLSQQGDIPGSLDAITRAAQLSPRNSTILLKKAAILIKAGERERANREILNVLDILPGNKSALDLLASLRINTSTPLSFIQVEHDLLIEPNNTWSAFNKGRLLFEERKYRDAVAWFTKAATYDPANAAAWYLMGAAYNELENYPNAMVALKRSRELDPANPGTYYEMGRASEKLGNQTAARLYYETAVKINPDNAWTRYAYGKILATSGAYEPAINELAISLASSPCQASAWYELAMAYYRTGSYDHALDAINKAITIEPYTKEYKELYLQIRAAQDPASWSLTNVTKQLAKEPTNASLWFYQGAIAYHDGRYTDALSSLDKAVSYDPLHAQAWYYRGMSQYELGLYQEALCSFDKAIILDPANAWAYYYREISCTRAVCVNTRSPI
jgi:tetratricopeptide (TPR) repeat protein